MPSSKANRKGSGEPLITDVKLRGIIAASNLTPTQRGTLLMMADGLYRYTLQIIMGIERLQTALGLGRRATIARIRSLENSGAIVKVRGGGGRSETGKGYVNIWNLDLDALRLQALDREADDPDTPTQSGVNETATSPPKSISKGADSCTVNGAWNQPQGCGIPTATVQQTAHDPISPTTPKKESNKESAAIAADIQGKQSRPPIRQRRKNPDHLIPWVNRYDGPKQTRANRLDQIRDQLARDEENVRRKSQNQLDSSKEGES
mgnify:CR=1 FL=1|tara:strand:- start:85 stop:873 length:789 start_codon:yes stop_codon:yes gene_type:complete